MALPTTTIFKSFSIVPNADNTGVLFSKNDPLPVWLKNDNFAEQVEIYDNAGTDFFDYKYITFDNSAIFEIMDCIKNGDYTTLFIQYLSNIKFDVTDNNFRVDGVTPATLQQLGLDVNEFIKILGNDTGKYCYTALGGFADSMLTPPTGDASMLVAVKLRFNPVPENLSVQLDGDGNYRAEIPSPINLTPSAQISKPIANILAPKDIDHISLFDNALSAFLIVPLRGRIDIDFGNGEEPFSYGFKDFLTTLNALSTDLTLSAELTIMTNDTYILVVDNESTPRKLTITQTKDVTTITLSNFILYKPFLLVPDGAHISEIGYINAAPVFINAVASNLTGHGVLEVLNIMSFDVRLDYYRGGMTNGMVATTLYLFGNEIDISKYTDSIRTNGGRISIGRGQQSMRIYVSNNSGISAYSRISNYIEINTSMELTKSTYSNYLAYKKANIDLSNSQATDALMLKQKQQDGLNKVDLASNAASTLMGAGMAFLSSPVAGVSTLVGGAINTATQQVKANMQKHNDRANARLSAQQAHELAYKTVTPTQLLPGSINITDIGFVYRDEYNTKYYTAFYAVGGVSIFYDADFEKLKKYIFDNYFMQKIVDKTEVKTPLWLTGKTQKVYQAKICNRSPINTRKDFIIFVEDKTT